jgi:TPR repeat protein
MARLILKSPYIKSTGGASGYLKYIATRERVQIIADDRPPTRKQEQLITKLVKDFPDSKDLYEYEDYAAKPTKANASAFISLALESNWDKVSQSDGYMKYIATRPRAERLGSHGLFGDDDHVDLDKAMAEMENYTGNVWTHIISLHREDAARLGYDNAQTWRDLIRAHRNDISEAMKIPPNDFRWYAAFHDEGDHPHIHMMAWSVKPGQVYLSRDGIRQIKSKLTNDIFSQEMLHLYEQKTVARDDLVREARQAMVQLVREMRDSICDQPDTERLMQELSSQLETVHGKKSYGYLPKQAKKIVDEIVDQMERLPVVSECYDQWWQIQCWVDDYYSDKNRKRPKLSEQKEFRAIKNAVLREAETIRLGVVTFEDTSQEKEDEPEVDTRASYAYQELKEVLQDDTLSLEDWDAAADEMKRLADGGDPYAQHLMGKLYRDGPLLTPDWRMARYYFELAAEQGLTAAQYALGKLLLSEDIEVRDSDGGIRWLESAARNGSDYAAYRLGKEYLRGKFVEQDTGKAVAYFTQAAEMGNQYGQYMLGKLYLMGREVPYDEERAIYWLSQSAYQGNAYAQFFLDRQDDFKPPSVMLSVTRLLHHMGNIFQDHSLPKSGPTGMQIDRKRLQQLREKKMALGHKWNDHEDQGWGGMTMGGF